MKNTPICIQLEGNFGDPQIFQAPLFFQLNWSFLFQYNYFNLVEHNIHLQLYIRNPFHADLFFLLHKINAQNNIYNKIFPFLFIIFYTQKYDWIIRFCQKSTQGIQDICINFYFKCFFAFFKITLIFGYLNFALNKIS